MCLNESLGLLSWILTLFLSSLFFQKYCPSFVHNKRYLRVDCNADFAIWAELSLDSGRQKSEAKVPVNKEMTDSWAITRELPAGENTPVMASIKMEDSIADEGAGPRPQPGLSRDIERSGWRRKSLRHAGGGLQEIGGVHDEDGSNLGTKAPVDYSMMQERHHGSFNPLTPAGYVVR